MKHQTASSRIVVCLISCLVLGMGSSTPVIGDGESSHMLAVINNIADGDHFAGTGPVGDRAHSVAHVQGRSFLENAFEASQISDDKNVKPEDLLEIHAAIVNAAGVVFDEISMRREWILTVGLLSQFNGGKISKGQQGVGRLLGIYRKPLVALCGDDLRKSGVKEPNGDQTFQSNDVSAVLSACYFKKLVDATGGDITIARSQYRFGAHAKRLFEAPETSIVELVGPAAIKKNVDAQARDKGMRLQGIKLEDSTSDLDRVIELISLSRDAVSYSSTRTVVLADIIVKTASELKMTSGEKAAWANFISAHTGFVGKSQGGRIGLGGVVSTKVKELSAACGYELTDEGYAQDDAFSAYLSACLYTALYRKYEQNEALASLAYAASNRSGKIDMGVVSFYSGSRKSCISTKQRERIGEVVHLINSTAIPTQRIKSVRDARFFTAHVVSRVAGKVLGTDVAPIDWFILLNIENNFRRRGLSSAGAVGIGQLIPVYRADFGRSCGIDDVTLNDLEDITVNSILSACYFRSLIRSEKLTSAALVAYNAGPYHPDLNKLRSMSSINHESANYVTKFNVMKELFQANRSDADTVIIDLSERFAAK